MPLFVTAFTPPAPLTGLTVTGIGGAAVVLEWDPSPLAGGDFVDYRVYRSLSGHDDDFTLLATITDQSAATFSDYTAPLDRAIWYRVTHSNLDFESDPAEAVTALEGCSWWIVTPGAAAESFELPNVTEYQSQFPLQSIEHEPIGRPTKLVETGLLLAEEGNLTTYLLPTDAGILDLLRAAASGASTQPLLKTPYGEVFAVAVGTIQRTRQPGGRQEVSFRFVAV